MNILYPNSPFLPEVSSEDVQKLEQEKRNSLLKVIALHCGEIEERQFKIIESEKRWILENFNCQLTDLLLYKIGFNTLIIMILSGIQYSTEPPEKVFKNLTTPTKLPFHKEHNIYMVNILYDSYHIIQDKPDWQIPQTINNFADLLLNKRPYSENKFYISGIQSCQRTLISLYKSITLP